MIEALDVIAASAAGYCVALGLRWLGAVAAPRLWRWLNEDEAVDFKNTPATPRHEDEYVYDLAGNVVGIAGPPIGVGLHRVATPVEHVEVAANKLTSIGFLAMSVRVDEGAGLSEGEYDAAVNKVEAAAARLTEELRLCRGCRRWGGEHAAQCGEVAEMVDMADEAMMYEHKPDVSRGD